nr:hypothetical protein [Tanacetum cinerariifolium]
MSFDIPSLWNSGGDSGPDLSFNKSASLECLFSLAHVSLAEAAKPDLSFGCSGRDHTSSICLWLRFFLSASSFSLSYPYIVLLVVMPIYAALVQSRTPDMSHSLISRYWHPDAYLARSIWPAADLCIRAVAPSRIPFSIYSWIGVIQVLVASLIIALTSAVSTDRSLSSSIRTSFVSPSHCTAASLLKSLAFLFSSLGRRRRQGFFVFVRLIGMLGPTDGANVELSPGVPIQDQLRRKSKYGDCEINAKNIKYGPDDPRPAAGSFSMADVHRLSAYVIKLREMPEDVLLLFVMGIHDFLCLPEWTSAEVQADPHLDVRPTLQRLPFYCTPSAASMLLSRIILWRILPLVPLVLRFLLRLKLLRSERPLLLVPLRAMLPSEYSSPTRSIRMRPAPDPCSLDAPSEIEEHFSFYHASWGVFDAVGFKFYSPLSSSSRCLSVVQYLAYWLVCDNFVCIALELPAAFCLRNGLRFVFYLFLLVVEVNLRGLLGLGKMTSAILLHKDGANNSEPDISFDIPASSEFWCKKHILLPELSFLFSSAAYFTLDSSPSLLDPLGRNKVITFEVLYQSLQIEPTVTLFRGFQDLCKQGDWFSFAKRRAPSPVCIDDNRSCMKHCFPFTALHLLRQCCYLESYSGGSYRWYPSSKILAKAEASQKRKASTSGAALSHVAKRTRSALAQSSSSTTRASFFVGDSDDESDGDDDACVKILLITPLRFAVVIPSSGNQGQSSIALTTEGPNTRDSWGKGIMADDVATPFVGNCEFTREEWDAAYRPTFGVLTKEVFKDPIVCKTMVDQFPTPGEMSHHKFLGLMINLLPPMLLFPSSRLREMRGRKNKSLTKSLDNLHAEVARLSTALNQAIVLEAEKDEEILHLKTTPPEFASFFRGQFQDLVRKFFASDEFSRVHNELLSLAASAGFERGLSMHQTKDEFAAVLKKMANFMPGIFVALEDDVELAEVGSGRASSGPNDVMVAFSLVRKVMVWFPHFPLEGACGMPKNTCCSELGKTDYRCVVVYPTDPESCHPP